MLLIRCVEWAFGFFFIFFLYDDAYVCCRDEEVWWGFVVVVVVYIFGYGYFVNNESEIRVCKIKNDSFVLMLY